MTYQLVGDEDDRLESDVVLAIAHELFERLAEQLHHQHMIISLGAKVVKLRDTV